MNKFSKSFYAIISFALIFVILCVCFFTPIFVNQDNIVFTNDNGFLWPTPGYTTITSGFGYRTAPTAGASSFHSGIDIGAPEGAAILSIFSGVVTYTGFNGGRRFYCYNKK